MTKDNKFNHSNKHTLTPYETRQFLFYNRAYDWIEGQNIVIFYFDSKIPQCMEYLIQFVQLAIVEDQNYYLFITQEINSLDMHVLDVIPDLLKFNIVNDDGSFLPWITLKAIPVIAFYTGIGRFSGEFHPTNNKVRGRLSSKQLSTESEFIKHQLVLASTNKSNIVWQILNAQDRDTAFKNKYHEYELNDISDLYVPKKITAMKPNFQQVKRTDFFFIDNISRRILNINFQVFPSAKKSHRKFLTGKISSHDTFEFNFQSDLNLKSAQMIPFSRDVIQPHIYRQKEVNSSIIKMRNSQMYNIE